MCGGISRFMEQHIERILQKRSDRQCMAGSIEEMKVSCYVLVD
jgi:hypothetical protein